MLLLASTESAVHERDTAGTQGGPTHHVTICWRVGIRPPFGPSRFGETNNRKSSTVSPTAAWLAFVWNFTDQVSCLYVVLKVTNGSSTLQYNSTHNSTHNSTDNSTPYLLRPRAVVVLRSHSYGENIGCTTSAHWPT